MAVFTYIRSLDVLWILANRVAAVVATNAIAGHVNVVKRCRSPGNGGVAIVTGIVTGNVSWMLAGRYSAVMTRATSPDHLCVVHGESRRENVGVVAVLTDIAGRDVGQALANRLNTIVTVYAVAGDVHMVEIRRQPANC